MSRLLQSSWFAALLGCLIYLGTTAAMLNPSKFAGAHPVDNEVKRSADNDPSWKFRNPEFDQWVSEIKREKELLTQREQQLQDVQTRLDAERQEISTVTQAVAQMQAEFDRNVVRFKAQEPDNLKRQIKVLTGMSPEGAATLLSESSDDQVIRMLVLMKPDQASAILDAFSKKGKDSAHRASAILDRMHNVITPPAAGSGNSTP